MSVDPETVFNAALQLTEEERLDLAYRILDSVPGSSELRLDDPNLRDELERRSADRENFVPRSELWADDSLREELDRRSADREGSIPWTELRGQE